MVSYRLTDPIPDAIRAELKTFHPAAQQLFYNRGVTSRAAAESWCTPVYETTLHDPFLLHDMDTAVIRVLTAIEHNEHIVVYSDYDCDGIPGAVVLHDFFTEIGFTNFSTYIPHRHYEGFGFNEAAAEKLAADGAQLIITVDCGMGDYAAVAAAQAAGTDVIVTDHHQPSGELPPATAVVNPAISPTYPFPHLCGAGVVFKLVQALLDRGSFAVTPGREKWWLDMVGMATIADMVSLTEENRTLAHYGLVVLRKSRRPGLHALLKQQRASQAHLNESDIGFTIGPRINAASRMGEADRAFKLLTATTAAEAQDHLAHIEQLNNERKGAVAAMTRAAHKKLAQQETVSSVIVLGDPEWRPSLVGLVANKLAEEHSVPAFVWGRDGNGVIKGSCRSGGDMSVLRIMEAGAEYFIEYGGHHASGGFAVTDATIHTLGKQLQAVVMKLDTKTLEVAATPIDLSLTATELTAETLTALLALGPFGVGNPKPLLQITDVRPTHVDVFGKGKEHIKLQVPGASRELEAIAFFKQPQQFTHQPVADTTCTLLAEPEQSYFRGRAQLRLRIVDVLPEPVT